MEDPVEELPPFSRKAIREALHRDFDDERDLSVRDSEDGEDGFDLPVDPAFGPPSAKTPWTPFHWLVTGIGILLVAQVPLWWAFSEASEGEGPPIFTCADLDTPRAAKMSPRERVQLELRCDPNTRTVQTFIRADDPADKIPEDAQVVELDMPEAVDPEPVETKYLAEVTTRTDKETRSEVVAPSKKRPGARRAPKTPAPTAASNATSPEPTAAPQDAPIAPTDAEPSDAEGEPDKAKGPEEPQVADIVKVPKADSGQAPASVMARGMNGGGARILMPATSERNVIANIQALAGGDFTSTDHLPGVDRGASTVLNANSYKYADFFHTVKRAVERHWRPSQVYLRRDPTGQTYGVKDRYTVLRVELDGDGNLVRLTTVRQSGLDFMDDEAKRAFREAAPFPNPPLGLVDDDGRIRFEFGFFFEITGGKYRFNWRRL